MLDQDSKIYLISLIILLYLLDFLCGYFKEKLHINHFWKLKGFKSRISLFTLNICQQLFFNLSFLQINFLKELVSFSLHLQIHQKDEFFKVCLLY